jgi:hypothetical protein
MNDKVNKLLDEASIFCESWGLEMKLNNLKYLPEDATQKISNLLREISEELLK